ncbi:hypothetical protein H1R20_g9458, partial [Candolleomyces eurysporus]
MARVRMTCSGQKQHARSRKSPLPSSTPRSLSPQAGPSGLNVKQPDNTGDALIINPAPGQGGNPPAGQGDGPVGNFFQHPDPNHVVPPPPVVSNRVDLEHSLQNVKGLYFHCKVTGGHRRVELPFVRHDARTMNP